MSEPGDPVVGIDVGGTKLQGIVLDPARPSAGPVRAERRDTPRGTDALVGALVELVELLSPRGRVRAVGVGIAGLVDGDGALRTSPNLPGVVGAPLRALLGDALGVPVAVDNDAAVAALAEARFGAGRGVRDVVVLTLGTGIGGGIVLDGELRRGANGFGGEFGHQVVDPHGPPCPCGRRGCWERFASGSGLGRLAREAAHAGRLGGVVAASGGDAEDVRGEHVVAAAREGDPQASAVIDDFTGWISLGVANLVTALDPALVVLGGGVLGAADLLLDRVREGVHDRVMSARVRPPVEIRAASLGAEAGAVGAAVLVLESIAPR